MLHFKPPYCFILPDFTWVETTSENHLLCAFVKCINCALVEPHWHNELNRGILEHLWFSWTLKQHLNLVTLHFLPGLACLSGNILACEQSSTQKGPLSPIDGNKTTFTDAVIVHLCCKKHPLLNWHKMYKPGKEIVAVLMVKLPICPLLSLM